MIEEQSQTVFLCEGYHDRAFLGGWLKVLGCKSLGEQGVRVVDPWGRSVTAGQFGYTDPLGRFVKVVPVRGDKKLFPVARDLLQGRQTQRIRDLFIVADEDLDRERRLDQFRHLVSELDPNIKASYTTELTDGTKVHLLLLSVKEPPGPGIPVLQCLERIVCTAISDCHSDRAALVGDWLSKLSLGDDSASEAKAAAWSYMAGWYPKFGCEAFYSAVWEQPEIRDSLIVTLGASWALVSSAIAP